MPVVQEPSEELPQQKTNTGPPKKELSSLLKGKIPSVPAGKVFPFDGPLEALKPSRPDLDEGERLPEILDKTKEDLTAPPAPDLDGEPIAPEPETPIDEECEESKFRPEAGTRA